MTINDDVAVSDDSYDYHTCTDDDDDDEIQCSSNISRSSGSRVRCRDINGARYKSRHVPCMYNGVHNTRSVCRCGSLLRHHG